MRKAGLLSLFLLLFLTGLPEAQARVEPGTPLEMAPDPAYAIADEQFINGTLRDQLAVTRWLEAHGGPLAGAELEPVAWTPMPAPVALAFLGEAYSVSPSLLLALVELEDGALSAGELPRFFSARLRWLARDLSRWFYDYYYRVGAARDGGPPALNAGNGGTYALRNYFFTQVYGSHAYPLGDRQAQLAAWERALAATYSQYFGSPWAGRLVARHPAAADWAALPSLQLPWRGSTPWYFTGGPHSFDGSERLPMSGVDFQPEGYAGCHPPVARPYPVTAVAGGQVVGYLEWWVKVDHDDDGDALSGWQTVYGHLAQRVPAGQAVRSGQPLGYPSCYGGFASGVHVHFGVKFENVWQPITAFSLAGWHFSSDGEEYEGWMVHQDGAERQACFRSATRTFACGQGVVAATEQPQPDVADRPGVPH
jgi:murein DD-endopeptidase MepM/ murein hydrolase activator NlpD